MRKIHLIPALNDNYIYMLEWENKIILIDPADELPVLKKLTQLNQTNTPKDLIPTHILITHHHLDHVAGNLSLKQKFNCKIIGPDDSRIPGLDQIVKEKESFTIGPFYFEVLFVPGHTSTHIAYYLPKEKVIFTGDSLFAGGCGRLFEGSPEEMLYSLKKIQSLPEETKIYCGHEYTLNNLEFAHSIEPSNKQINDRLEKVKEKRSNNQATIPSTLKLEKLTNPFLRANTPEMKTALNMEGASEIELFTALRHRKDLF